MQQLHPLRLQYELFSDANPMMAPVAAAGGAGPQGPQARGRRQSVRRDAGERVAADRRRRSTRWRDMTRGAGRADVPGGLRLADAAGRGRHRSGRDAPAAEGGQEPAASASSCEKRIAELKSRIPAGGAARSRDPRDCSMSAWRGPRSTSAASRRCAASAQTHGDMPLVGLQGARARAVLHAADRSGGGARGHSVDAAGRCGDPARGVRPDQAGAGRARRSCRPRTRRDCSEVARLFGVDRRASECGADALSPAGKERPSAKASVIGPSQGSSGCRTR